MAEYKAKRNPNRCPSHPGAVLDDILPSLGKPKVEIARLLGISRQHLHEILEEKKPVSPNVAARIGKLIGNGPAIWLRLQAAYDACHAEREVDVSKIPTLEQAWMRSLLDRIGRNAASSSHERSDVREDK